MNITFTKNIKAYVQILPYVDEEWEFVKILDDQKTLYVRCLQDFGKGKNMILPNFWTFCTDGILNVLNNDEIFDLVIKESLKKTITGIDTLIFGYGQTGSGKSSTLNGLLDNYENRGLIPRIIEEIFELKELNKHEMKIEFGVTFVEIRKTNILDILHDQLVPHPYKNKNIENIKSEKDAFKLLFKGESKRKTYYNSYMSNLFTSVFTIYVRNKSRVISNPTEKIAKIHIIDMAGVDTDGNSSCQWKTSLEVGVGNLNKSQLELCLSTLNGDLIRGKSSIKDAGMLVDYLGSSLKPTNIVRFIGHIRTTKDDLAITISTLRFANIARCVKSAELQPVIKDSLETQVQHLQQEVLSLTKQNYLNAMLFNDDLSYNITDTRMQQMQAAVEDYIKNKSSDLILLNVTDARIAINIFKEICIKLAEEIVEIKKQLEVEVMTLNTVSKGSVTSAQQRPTEEKVPKKSKTYRSRESQLTARKRRSSEKSSKYSKLSAHSKNKVSATGSITKSGFTIGQILSYDFEGDPTKTLKLTSKTLIKTSIDCISEEINSMKKRSSKIGSVSASSSLGLQLELGEDFEEVWNAYKYDINFDYGKWSLVLTKLETDIKDTLKDFHNKIEVLQEKVDTIDLKKNDLLKIQIFKDINDECSTIDLEKLEDVRENIAFKIIELINETVQYKENLLELQSDMKININEYHRIKENIKKDFTNYCYVHNKIKVPSEEEIIQCIEDKLNEVKVEEPKIIENPIKNAFYKFQNELRKSNKKKINEKTTFEPSIKICEKIL